MGIIIEIDGIRHRQVADGPGFTYCEATKCSLYEICQNSSGCICNINNEQGELLHYEKEE